MTKSNASSPSEAKTFSIKSIMQKKTDQNVRALHTSTAKFGVSYENGFVFSEDGNHVIAPDATDMRRLRVENLTTNSSFCFGMHHKIVQTLIFDEDSRSLFAGDFNGHLVQYDLDLEAQTGGKVKDYGDLNINSIRSSFRFTGFVFFGGKSAFRVLDLCSMEMLNGHIESAIKQIQSLQVCAVDRSRIFLAAIGFESHYSSYNSDLFDLGVLLEDVSISKEVINKSSTNSKQNKANALLTRSRKIISNQNKEIDPHRKGKNNEKLQKTIESLQADLDQKTRECDALRAQNEDLKQQKRQLKKERDSQEETMSSVLKVNEGLQAKVAEIKLAFEEKQKQLQDLLEQKRADKNKKLRKKLMVLNSARKRGLFRKSGKSY